MPERNPGDGPTIHDPLREGSILSGRYELTKRLDGGAMGVVWKATDTQRTNRVWALKVLPPVLWADESAIELVLSGSPPSQAAAAELGIPFYTLQGRDRERKRSMTAPDARVASRKSPTDAETRVREVEAEVRRPTIESETPRTGGDWDMVDGRGGAQRGSRVANHGRPDDAAADSGA